MFNSPMTMFSPEFVMLLGVNRSQIRSDAASRRRVGLSVFVPGPFVKIPTSGKISAEWSGSKDLSSETKLSLSAFLRPGAEIPEDVRAFIVVTPSGEAVLVGDAANEPKVSLARESDGSRASISIEYGLTPLKVMI